MKTMACNICGRRLPIVRLFLKIGSTPEGHICSPKCLRRLAKQWQAMDAGDTTGIEDAKKLLTDLFDQ